MIRYTATCPQKPAHVGQTVYLKNTLTSKIPLHTMTFKKDSTVIATFPDTTASEQSCAYQLQPSDVGTRRFSVDVTYMCLGTLRSASGFCYIKVKCR